MNVTTPGPPGGAQPGASVVWLRPRTDLPLDKADRRHFLKSCSGVEWSRFPRFPGRPGAERLTGNCVQENIKRCLKARGAVPPAPPLYSATAAATRNAWPTAVSAERSLTRACACGRISGGAREKSPALFCQFNLKRKIVSQGRKQKRRCDGFGTQG